MGRFCTVSCMCICSTIRTLSSVHMFGYSGSAHGDLDSTGGPAGFLYLQSPPLGYQDLLSAVIDALRCAACPSTVAVGAVPRGPAGFPTSPPTATCLGDLAEADLATRARGLPEVGRGALELGGLG